MDPRLPARVRELRRERGYGLTSLAARAYVGRSTISDVERGRKRPTQETIAALDRALEADGELVAMLVPPTLLTAPSPSPGRLVDEQDLVRIRHTIEHLVALDTAHGADDVLPLAMRIYHAARSSVENLQACRGLERDHYAVVADLGALLGWLLYDARRWHEARALSLDARQIAQRCG